MAANIEMLDDDFLASLSAPHAPNAPPPDVPQHRGFKTGAEKDDEAFNELFAEDALPPAQHQTPGAFALPRRPPQSSTDELADRSSSVRRCSTCGSSSLDPGLSDKSASRGTPFTRMTTQRSLMCDHCELLLRYQQPDKSTSLGDTRRRILENDSERKSHLRRLAIYLALKQECIDHTNKIRQVKVAKAMDMVASQSHIGIVLFRRSGLEPDDKHESSMPSTSKGFRGLRDYMKKYGNPLLNGHTLQQGTVNDQVVILVDTPHQSEPGRHSLNLSASGGNTNADIKRLSMMTTDTVGDLRLVQHLNAEFNSREKWKSEVNALKESTARSNASERSGMESGIGASEDQQDDHGAKPDSDASDEHDDEDAEDEEDEFDDLFEPTDRDARSEFAAASPAASSVPFRSPAKTMKHEDDKSSAFETPPSRQPMQHRPRCSSTTETTAASASAASSAKKSPAGGDAIDKLGKRTFEVCKTFNLSNWFVKQRSKEVLIKRLQEALSKQETTCLTSRKENFIPFLSECFAATKVAWTLGVEGKAKKCDDIDESLFSEIKLISNFLVAHRAKYDTIGSTMDVTPNLKKGQVCGGQGGYNGQI